MEDAMSTDQPGPHRIRTSDAEREQYARILRAAMAEGRLSLDEGEERLARVYAATYRDELSPLTADLPDGGRQALYDTPEARAEARTGFRRHIGVAATVAAVLLGLWLLSPTHFFWPLFPLLFLGFGVLRRRRWARWQRGGDRWGGGWGGSGWSGSGWGTAGPGGPPWSRGRSH
jgi:hypothetical protein